MNKSQVTTPFINRTEQLADQDTYITCHQCHIVSKFVQTKPVYNTNGQESGERVCDGCRVENVRKTFKCPLQSCTTPHNRSPKFRTLPSKFYEIPDGHFKREVINYFGISKDTKACCNLCYIKITKAALVAKSRYNGETTRSTPSPTNIQGKTVDNPDVYSGPKFHCKGGIVPFWLQAGGKYNNTNNLDGELTVLDQFSENYVDNENDSEKSEEHAALNYEPSNGRIQILEEITSPPKTRIQSGKIPTSKPVTSKKKKIQSQERIPTLEPIPPIKTSPIKIKFSFKKRQKKGVVLNDKRAINDDDNTASNTHRTKKLSGKKVDNSDIADRTISLIETCSESEENIVVISEKSGNGGRDKISSLCDNSQSVEEIIRQKNIVNDINGDNRDNGEDSQSGGIGANHQCNDIDLQIDTGDTGTDDVAKTSNYPTSIKEYDFSTCKKCSNVFSIDRETTGNVKVKYCHSCGPTSVEKCIVINCKTPKDELELDILPSGYFTLSRIEKKILSKKFGLHKHMKKACKHCHTCISYTLNTCFLNHMRNRTYTMCQKCERVVPETSTVSSLTEDGNVTLIECMNCLSYNSPTKKIVPTLKSSQEGAAVDIDRSNVNISEPSSTPQVVKKQQPLPRKHKLSFHHTSKGVYEVTCSYKKDKEITGGTASIKLGKMIGIANCQVRVCKTKYGDQQRTSWLYSFTDIWNFCSVENADLVKKNFKIDTKKDQLCCYCCFNELKWYIAFLNDDVTLKGKVTIRNKSKKKRFNLCHVGECKGKSNTLSFTWLYSYDDLLEGYSKQEIKDVIKKYHLDETGKGFCCHNCLNSIRAHMVHVDFENRKKNMEDVCILPKPSVDHLKHILPKPSTTCIVTQSSSHTAISSTLSLSYSESPVIDSVTLCEGLMSVLPTQPITITTDTVCIDDNHDTAIYPIVGSVFSIPKGSTDNAFSDLNLSPVVIQCSVGDYMFPAVMQGITKYGKSSKIMNTSATAVVSASKSVNISSAVMNYSNVVLSSSKPLNITTVDISNYSRSVLSSPETLDIGRVNIKDNSVDVLSTSKTLNTAPTNINHFPGISASSKILNTSSVNIVNYSAAGLPSSKIMNTTPVNIMSHSPACLPSSTLIMNMTPVNIVNYSAAGLPSSKIMNMTPVNIVNYSAAGLPSSTLIMNMTPVNVVNYSHAVLPSSKSFNIPPTNTRKSSPVVLSLTKTLNTTTTLKTLFTATADIMNYSTKVFSSKPLNISPVKNMNVASSVLQCQPNISIPHAQHSNLSNVIVPCSGGFLKVLPQSTTKTAKAIKVVKSTKYSFHPFTAGDVTLYNSPQVMSFIPCSQIFLPATQVSSSMYSNSTTFFMKNSQNESTFISKQRMLLPRTQSGAMIYPFIYTTTVSPTPVSQTITTLHSLVKNTNPSVYNLCTGNNAKEPIKAMLVTSANASQMEVPTMLASHANASQVEVPFNVDKSSASVVSMCFNNDHDNSTILQIPKLNVPTFSEVRSTHISNTVKGTSNVTNDLGIPSNSLVVLKACEDESSVTTEISTVHSPVMFSLQDAVPTSEVISPVFLPESIVYPKQIDISTLPIIPYIESENNHKQNRTCPVTSEIMRSTVAKNLVDLFVFTSKSSSTSDDGKYITPHKTLSQASLDLDLSLLRGAYSQLMPPLRAISCQGTTSTPGTISSLLPISMQGPTSAQYVILKQDTISSQEEISTEEDLTQAVLIQKEISTEETISTQRLISTQERKGSLNPLAYVATALTMINTLKPTMATCVVDTSQKFTSHHVQNSESTTSILSCEKSLSKVITNPLSNSSKSKTVNEISESNPSHNLHNVTSISDLIQTTINQIYKSNVVTSVCPYVHCSYTNQNVTKHDKMCQTEFPYTTGVDRKSVITRREILQNDKARQHSLIYPNELLNQRSNDVMTVKLDKICQTGLVYSCDSRDQCTSSSLKEPYLSLADSKLKNAVRKEAKDLYGVFMNRLNELTLGCGKELLSELTHPKELPMVADYKKIIMDHGELYKKTDRKNMQERLRLLSAVALHASNDLLRVHFRRYTTKGDLVSVNEDEIKQARDYARQFGPGIPLAPRSWSPLTIEASQPTSKICDTSGLRMVQQTSLPNQSSCISERSVKSMFNTVSNQTIVVSNITSTICNTTAKIPTMPDMMLGSQFSTPLNYSINNSSNSMNSSLPGCLISLRSPVLYDTSNVSLPVDTSSQEASSCMDNYSLKDTSRKDICSCMGPHMDNCFLKISSHISSLPGLHKDNPESNILNSSNVEIDRHLDDYSAENDTLSPVYNDNSIDFNWDLIYSEKQIKNSDIETTKVAGVSSPQVTTDEKEEVSNVPLAATETNIINTIPTKLSLSLPVCRKRNSNETDDSIEDEQMRPSKKISNYDNVENHATTSKENSDNSFMKRKRTKFSETEKNTLEGFYSDIAYHGKKKSIEEIQNVLDLDKQTINTWFRNRKCKEKKEELGRSLKNMSTASNDVKKLYEIPSCFLDSDSEDDTLYIDDRDTEGDNITTCDNVICDNDTTCDNGTTHDVLNIEATHDNTMFHDNTKRDDVICGKDMICENDEDIRHDTSLIEETIIQYLCDESQLVTDTEIHFNDAEETSVPISNDNSDKSNVEAVVSESEDMPDLTITIDVGNLVNDDSVSMVASKKEDLTSDAHPSADTAENKVDIPTCKYVVTSNDTSSASSKAVARNLDSTASQLDNSASSEHIAISKDDTSDSVICGTMESLIDDIGMEYRNVPKNNSNKSNVVAVGPQSEKIPNKNIRINISELFSTTATFIDTVKNSDTDADTSANGEKIASNDSITGEPSEHVTSNVDSGTTMKDIANLDSASFQNNIYSLEHVMTSKDVSDTPIVDVNNFASTAFQSGTINSSEHAVSSKDVSQTPIDVVNNFASTAFQSATINSLEYVTISKDILNTTTEDVTNHFESTFSQSDVSDYSAHVAKSKDLLDTSMAGDVNDLVRSACECDINSSKHVIIECALDTTMEDATDVVCVKNMVVDIAESSENTDISKDSSDSIVYQPEEPCIVNKDNISEKSDLDAVGSQSEEVLKAIHVINNIDTFNDVGRFTNPFENSSFDSNTSHLDRTWSNSTSHSVSDEQVSTLKDYSDTETLPYASDDEHEDFDLNAFESLSENNISESCEPIDAIQLPGDVVISRNAKNNSDLDQSNACELLIENDIVSREIFAYSDASNKNIVDPIAAQAYIVSKAIDAGKPSGTDTTSRKSENKYRSTCNREISLANNTSKIQMPSRPNKKSENYSSQCDARGGQCVSINASTHNISKYATNMAIELREFTIKIEKLNIDDFKDDLGCVSNRGVRYLKRKFSGIQKSSKVQKFNEISSPDLKRLNYDASISKCESSTALKDVNTIPSNSCIEIDTSSQSTAHPLVSKNQINQPSVCTHESSTVIRPTDNLSSNSNIEIDAGFQSCAPSLQDGALRVHPPDLIDIKSNEDGTNNVDLSISIKKESGLEYYCDFPKPNNMKVEVDIIDHRSSSENSHQIHDPEELLVEHGNNNNIFRNHTVNTHTSRSRLVSSVNNLSLIIPKKSEVTQTNTNTLTVSNSTNRSITGGVFSHRLPGISVMKETSQILDRWKNINKEDKEDKNEGDKILIRGKVSPSVSFGSSFNVPSLERTHNTAGDPLSSLLPSITVLDNGLNKSELMKANAIEKPYGLYAVVKKEYGVPSLRDLSQAVLSSLQIGHTFNSQSPQPPILSPHGPEPPVLTRHQNINRYIIRPVHLPPDLIPSYRIKRQHDR